MKTPEKILFEKKKKNFNKIRFFLFFLLIFFIAAIAYSIYYNNFFPSVAGLKIFFNNFFQLSQFKNQVPGINNLLFKTVEHFGYTILYCLIGTVCGFSFAFFSAFFCASNIQKEFIVTMSKIIMKVLSAIPFVLFAFIFVRALNDFLGIILFVWWISWMIFHRNLLMLTESQPIDIFAHWKARGKSNFISYVFMYKANYANIYAIFLTRVEANTRYTSFVPFFGTIHSSTLVQKFVVPGPNEDYGAVVIPLLTLLFFYLLLEILFIKLIKYVKYSDNKRVNFYTIKKSINIVKFFKLFSFIFLIMAAISLIIFAIWETKTSEWNLHYQVVSNIFKPTLNRLTLHFFANSLFSLLTQIVIGLGLVLFFGTLFGLLISRTLVNSRFSIVIKSIVYFFRVMPTAVLFFLIRPIFESSYATAILAISMLYTNNYIIAIKNELKSLSPSEHEWVKLLRKRYGWFHTVVHYIIPRMAKTTWSEMAANLSNMIQHMTTIGLFGAVIISEPYVQTGIAANASVQNLFDFSKNIISYSIPFIFIYLIANTIEYRVYNHYNKWYLDHWKNNWRHIFSNDFWFASPLPILIRTRKI